MKIKSILLVLSVAVFLFSCTEKQQVDQIIFAKGIYTMDSANTVAECVAISGNEIVAVGSRSQVERHYKADTTFDFPDRYIYPGFVDAHCHFLAYGIDKAELDLKDAISFDDMVEKVTNYGAGRPGQIVIGRGWNEENWEMKTRPSNYKLNFLFPNTPVVLQRIDGHSVLANQAAFEMAGIDPNEKIEGGYIEMINGIPTGFLVDKAAERVLDALPEQTDASLARALLDAQEDCFKVGLTSVSDAGLKIREIKIIDSLHRTGELKMRIYAMADPNRAELEAYCPEGPKVNDKLILRAVKLYCDGSLGSRSAWLKEPYCDDSTNRGLPQHDMSYYSEWATWCKDNGFQVNTHCIGDQANKEMLRIYGEVLDEERGRRWRIEHAQVVDLADMSMFTEFDVIPSVQPTHAVSDMYMAKKRLCTDERLVGAYAYHDLLQKTGLIALGTDFPVESIDPLGTFYSATLRSNEKRDVFRPDQKLDAISTIKGMTIDAAYANFMENEVGSLEPGKKADLVVLSTDLVQSRNRGEAKVVGTMSDAKWQYLSPAR